MSAGRRPLLPGDSPGVLVAVHAHPDDETLATGVALAHHVARGDRVHVITCTLGEEGEVIPPDLAHLEGSDALGPYRAGELSAAMARLGVDHEYLGGPVPRWRDSGMAGTASAEHPRAFVGADLAQAAELLAARLAELAPDAVLTYDPQGGYGHPDHIRTHEVTVAAVRSLPPAARPLLYAVLTPSSWAREDRAWLAGHVPADAGLTVPGPDEPYAVSVVDDDLVTHAVVDPAALGSQVAALREHATQVTVYDGYYALSNDIAARLAGREGYALLDPDGTFPGGPAGAGRSSGAGEPTGGGAP
ncbi:N-acetyl-1-D-myo-inositol-2-amino-2-deoxy-alpha-D-glucopyranoside deacetylase [Ornithinicoccus hortensis]|uniref:N-acetyl-1-D-myo-inositol-2-amino-2-deoxy-alpha-D-glucopyranoside deacetylase n=1 Tax=Ornithinicoccus hortensis TaxID=82346 RepID=A0A542YPZ9_9MICO|nr:N-acetyl-1-D-myo-inositol-2-amino-2-deoxy-alpha-D-glucopyranoside deacetylase [Ornithinicoccus hortensis]TQL50129.1 N-acetyl-1-D-myo-inositol-2-amino-2-deoxy-alpha-D-glucopyranoside deacetylase [Ornithinicoccus hortensis]